MEQSISPKLCPSTGRKLLNIIRHQKFFWRNVLCLRLRLFSRGPDGEHFGEHFATLCLSTVLVIVNHYHVVVVVVVVVVILVVIIVIVPSIIVVTINLKDNAKAIMTTHNFERRI
jgi:hypothetical protein